MPLECHPDHDVELHTVVPCYSGKGTDRHRNWQRGLDATSDAIVGLVVTHLEVDMSLLVCWRDKYRI